MACKRTFQPTYGHTLIIYDTLSRHKMHMLPIVLQGCRSVPSARLAKSIITAHLGRHLSSVLAPHWHHKLTRLSFATRRERLCTPKLMPCDFSRVRRSATGLAPWQGTVQIYDEKQASNGTLTRMLWSTLHMHVWRGVPGLFEL